MSYVAKKSRNELYRTNTCGVSHHRATPAVCSESFRSKETEAFPEHQDSPYVLCIHTNTHTHTSQRRFMSHRSPSPLSQGPNGPIGPTGPPGSRGSTGPKVSWLLVLQQTQDETWILMKRLFCREIQVSPALLERRWDLWFGIAFVFLGGISLVKG